MSLPFHPCLPAGRENLLAHPGSKDSHANWIRFRGAGQECYDYMLGEKKYDRERD